MNKSFNIQNMGNYLILILFVISIFTSLTVSAYQFAVTPGKPGEQAVVQNQGALVMNRINEYISEPNNGLMYRGDLAKFNNILKVKYLGFNEINSVVIGKQGWLYVNQNDSMKDFMGQVKYTEGDLLTRKNVILYRRNLLASMGIPMLLVVAPNKETIYPEYLPQHIKRSGNPTKLDQLLNYLAANSDIEVLDLRGSLIKARDKYQDYYVTDSHWNMYGGFVAYTQIVRQLNTYFTPMPIYDISDFKVTVETVPSDRDLTALISMEGMFQERVLNLEPIRLNRARFRNIPYAVIYHDSFYGAVQPWLLSYFGKINDIGINTGALMFDSAFIKTEQPSIVMYIMVERYIDAYLAQYK